MSGPSSDFLDPLLSPTHQDDGVDMIRRKNINFIGFTLTDNPGTNATDIVGAGGGVTHGTADQALVTNSAGTASLFAKIVNANVDAAAAIVLSKLGQSSASTGQVVTWSGTAWIAATPAAGTGGVAPGTNGQIFSTVGGVVTWQTVGGDITGAPSAFVVGKVNGATVPASGALTTGHVLKVSGASALSYGFVVDANVDAAAAIAGTKVAPAFGSQNVSTTGTVGGGAATFTGVTVSGLGAGIVHSSAGGAFTSSLIVDADVSSSAAIAISKLAPGTNGQVMATTAGVTSWATFGGDISGAPASVVVGKVKGTTVTTAGGALTTGQSLRATGVATADWGPIDLANPNAVTGTLSTATVTPGTNGQIFVTAAGAAAWATAGGDVTGAPSAFVVGKVKGTTVTTAGGALTTGQSLRATGVATADWGAVDLANLNAVTGVLPATNLAHGTADQALVTNGAGSTTVWAKIVDANVAAGAALGVTKLAAGAINTVLTTDGSGTIAWSTTAPVGSLPASAVQFQNVADIAAMQALVVTTFLDGTHCWVRTKDHAYILKTTAQTADPDIDTYNSAAGGRLWMGFA